MNLVPTSSHFQTWCQQIAFLPQKIVKKGYFIKKLKKYFIKFNIFQWRENVFELGADIFTFSNLVPTNGLFTSKEVKKGYLIEKFKKYGADQSARRYMFSRPWKRILNLDFIIFIAQLECWLTCLKN